MAGDDPPFLPVGTEVSAKYRGAFCEAKVKKIVRSVKCKIYLKETLTSIVVTDDTITKGSLKVGATVEYKNPDTGQLLEATISKLTDCSMYTVVFDDGDEKTLRRTQCCLKGEKHFIESETLDNLPLSHPEHFGTPVMSSKRKGRSGRQTFGNEEEDSEEESTDESLPRRATYKGRNQELVGKVFLAEIGEKKKQVLPVLVVLPDAHATELKTKDHLLVKSFKDGKFHTYLRKELKDFSKEAIAKIEDKNAKQALERAVTFSENQELPSNWEREELLGTDEEDFSDEEEGSDDEPSEEKDRFVAQLYKFMDDRGTSINRMPTLGNKDLNLYRLFNIVQTLGGYNKVTNLNKWKAVAGRMKTGLPSQNMVSHQLKTAYKKYLHAFEDFYRKLGSTMGTISRPGRSRNNSGRGMGVYKGHVKEQKEITAEREDSKSDGESDMEDLDLRSTRSPSKRERITRRDLDSVVRENRERRDGSKDSRRSDTFKQEEDGKKSVTIKEEGKKMKSTKKQEEKKESDEEETEAGKQEEKKKTIRRRSARKEDMKKDEEEEVEEKKMDLKSKSKVTAGKEPEVKPGLKKQEEAKEAKIDKKDEKKVDSKKEKAKINKKEVKKEVEEENKDLDKVEKKTKKEGGKKTKNEEETTPGKKKVKEETEEDMDTSEDFKPVTASEYPLGTKLQVRYGKGKTEKVYDAKIIEMQRTNNGLQYLVHYAGWNMRYDEWIRPDQVVNVLNKPTDISALKKKAKESPPKSPKGQANKKGKSPAAVPSPSSSAAVQRESRPIKRSPAHVSNTAPLKPSKQPRPTRSSSVEQRQLDSFPGKPRRTRRSSGLTESSDLVSQGSVSDDNNEFEGDIESDGTESVELKSNRDKDEVSEKTEDSKMDKYDDEKSSLVDYGKIMDKKTDILAVEQDLLNKAAEIEKVVELGEIRHNKSGDSKLDIKGKEEQSEKVEDQVVKSPPKLDSIGKSQELFPAKDLEMPTIQAIDEQVSVGSPAGSKEKKEDGKITSKEVDSKEVSEDMLPGKAVKNGEGSPVTSGDDRFEFKDEEETEKFPELPLEKEGKEKSKMTDSKDKTEVEVEKKQRGRKKDPNKTMEKKEPVKEKKRGRPSLASIAEKKAANQVMTKSQEDSEPKKTKEKSAEDIGDVSMVSPNKQEEVAFEPVTKNDEEITREENEFEKKKVKKKLKRKVEGSSDTETEKKEKKEPAKGTTGKSNKAEKTVKSKGKKMKEEEEADSVCEWEETSQGDSDIVSSDSNKPQSVISSESITVGAEHSESANKDITKDIGANLPESYVESKSEESVDFKSSASRLPNSSALYENTPPTTPEHEMDAPSSSQELTVELVKTDCTNSNDQQYASESPSGNASPSSNDGSVGSGNVACSESSNNEAPVHTSLGKRRRESEDVTPTKRKRRGKQKTERKLSKQTGSDSDEVSERRYSPEPGYASPSKTTTPVRSQRAPRYQLNLEEGKYLEGEKRISFLMEKIQEIRKIYMNLKSEVACIDRRRKRARRRERERESAQNSSSGTPEGETPR
ncbi:AT-rich interactive domain-containing protein 4A-like [Saccostrea echinata]|uniref:AT-rich interactive domain-containing protein 4A-like n=1 Tax=Saccostrea echinata TaxID=191078 RepID=UPI002A840206|nr:AT-rich interactive domain-containing protein 4A-like [Saccostrea echinata]